MSSSHEEILGYSLPVSRPSQRSSKSNGKAQKRKSAAYVDSEDEDPGDGTPKKKSKSTTKKPRATRTYADGATPTTGIHKEMNCSPALADVIGVPTVSSSLPDLTPFSKPHNPAWPRASHILRSTPVHDAYELKRLESVHVRKWSRRFGSISKPTLCKILKTSARSFAMSECVRFSM